MASQIGIVVCIGKQMDLTASFEIFDTCFVRACGSSGKIFTLLAEEILGDAADDTLTADFSLVRQNGERAARENSSREEVTLEEIYEHCDFSGLTGLPKCDIASAECRIEREQLIPVLSVKREIEKLRSRGCRIMYVSDTYLSEEFVKSLLEENGFWRSGDGLYLSSKLYLSKRTGNLFRYIARNDRIGYSQWRHYGGDASSDVAIPRKLGIKTSKTESGYSRYERKALRFGFGASRSINETAASVSRGVRLSLPDDNRYAFACDLTAPLYVPFVYGIMQDAVARGIGRLFFCARDGYILYRTAMLLKRYCFHSLELSYLYVSRCSLYPAGCDAGSDAVLERQLKEMFRQGGSFCESLAAFFPPEVCSAVLDAVPDLRHEPSAVAGVECMMKSVQVRSLLKEHISQQKNLLIRYFRQEGLADDAVKTAVIDLRGTRRSHGIINRILTENRYRPSFGYYLEVVKNRTLSDGQNLYKAFLQAEGNMSSFKSWFEAAPRVLEDYLSASPHKSTTHYREENDKVVPIFDDASFSRVSEEVCACHLAVMESFVRFWYLCGLHRHNDYCFNLGVELLADFFADPDGFYLTSLEGVAGGFCNNRPEYIVRKRSFAGLWTKNDGWEKGSFSLTLYLWRNRITNQCRKALRIWSSLRG